MEMEKRFSEMSDYELDQNIREFSEKARKAEQMGMVNEYAVYKRKIDMAKAYLLNPNEFEPGQVYEVNGKDFVIDHMKGTFAWGRLDQSDELSAYPISVLEKKQAL